MNYPILEGKRGLIFGALDENSIAWQVALSAGKAGAIFTLSNTPAAIRLGNATELSRLTNSALLAGDATQVEDLRNILIKSVTHLGGRLDFILHAIGMSPNVRKKKAYTQLDYSFYAKTMDVSALSFHKLLQTCWELDALAPNASVIALTHIAAQRVFPGYGDMSDAKAALESITRNFGYYYGKRNGVRVNTVSQSATKTTAGQGIEDFDKFFQYSEEMSPLGNADAASCADFCVMMFSDYTRHVTMQNIYHDGGFSQMGLNPNI